MHRRMMLLRTLSVIPTLIGVSLLLFFLVRRSPGDPAGMLAGERASQEVLDMYRQKFHLDEPFLTGYAYYMKNMVTGEFGRSYYTQESVFDALMQKLPNTLILATLSMAVATLAGIIIGVFTALFRGGFVDKFLSTISVIFISTPVFWAAIMLVLVFSLWLDWAPASTMGPAGLSAYILPAFVLGSRSAGYIARLTRSTMLDALSSDYIQTALAKGLPRWRVTVVHALRNSLIPVVTLVGIDFGSYLNGSVLTEKIFGIDGIGRYAINAIMKRDIPVIMGTVTFGALIFIAVNLIVDLLYFKLDARVSGAQVQDVI